MQYHIGLIRGSGRVTCWGNNHKDTTVVVQMRRDIDFLSPDLWEYIGIREVTKEYVKKNRVGLLRAINEQYQTEFTTLLVD